MADVLVIGGGPAGLSAARRLAEAGRSVVLVDEQPELGGQYYRRASAAVLVARGDHRPLGGDLIAAVRRAGVDVRTSTAVWGVGDDGGSVLTVNEVADVVRAPTIIVATGAFERVLPFPGWQLPGVTTPGFAQHLAGEGVPVGRRVLLAGSGPFLLPVACALVSLGVRVVGVAEAGSPYRLTTRSLGAVRFPPRLLELGGYALRLAGHQVPVWSGRVARAAIAGADGRVCAVELARTSDPSTTVATLAVDALCVGYGFRPQIELLRLLGCAMQRDASSGDLVPVIDAAGRTSRPDVWVAGEVGGIGGVHAALTTGDTVAEAILTGSQPAQRATSAQRRRRVSARFAEFTNSLYPAPASLAVTLAAAIPGSTQVCRCEGVDAATIRAAAGEPLTDRGAVKAATRAGMGPCQGRECAAAVAAFSSVTGHSPTGIETPRMPIRPVRIDALTRMGDIELPPPPPSDGELTAAGGAR